MTNASNSLTDLVGKFFHTTDKCEHGRTVAKWQGRITAAPAPGLLLIENYEWLHGNPNGEQFITIDEFVAKNPVLYETSDELRFSYEHGRLLHSSRCEPE
jgi:hypothetical protein